MSWKKKTILACISLILITPVFAGESGSFELLKERIKYAPDFEYAYKTIVYIYGVQDRDLGSGLFIPEWDVEGGFLVCHPTCGVQFRKDGKSMHLIITENRINENIIGSYSMSTNCIGRNEYWLGTLELSLGGTYMFQDGFTNMEHRSNQGHNFFLLNTKGTYSVTLLDQIQPFDLLENIEPGSSIARIEFTSKNGKEEFFVKTLGGILELRTTAGGILPYSLSKSWNQFYFEIG